ncbi:chymotrypsin inhibitor Ani s 6-like [Hyla sarda]|uniref:chymotrypsin inhibitor Ani s 6-like n=1 Tax=Hyla sarda TaxID=327740 RepID=UPI0024C45F28|nr:chymotrypsin inhibitor Ani s 6-like [Hyla sarda]XP_056399424.1 chymotrypsin inhibitor Ani s 6-like [Hyla sarda]XP_056399425.1 chymotrypsin inhibitor Ani s 6-like [Hyla sarda]XP_056399426.1 chymotrypsin inhibitor Ani s 6-like [Hyla sarda]XP_056399427.1 chymotrypsin inhibitor Ani s 6-like [Hyla sarda]XP_056399428.1 chymotrypsin inhibitor Ani s 6-like [Hyla sarda]XP_056399429.1 chymotrypsin inhibitor Ani s 6-like [Hyla sarda]
MGGTSVILLSSLSALLVLISVQAANIGYGAKPCPPGKEYNECGSGCTQSCDYILKKMVCAAMCEPGCFCPKGTVDNGSGKCVKIEECCKGNTTYTMGNDCGRVCPSRFKIGIVCTKELYLGCFCKPGYLHLGDRCVLTKDCPKITPFH